ncbi:MAG: hypothetical protein IJ555_02185 [Ruminococcus sp.]|nr:hypothetical protein [Ruminococcus sp.]
MKKLISGLSALAIMAMPLTAYAANPITEATEQKGEAVITTEIAPSYIVTIPADTTVKFHDLTTDFGKVELTKAQLDPEKVVKVTVNSDGELNNAADDKKVIPYTVMAQYASGAEGEVYVPFNVKGNDLTFDTTGQAFAMEIQITEDDWNKAYAGSYSDTVTFNVSYEDAPTPEPEP